MRAWNCLCRSFAVSSPILFLMPDQDARHRVYFFFHHRAGWQCQFLEEDLRTPLSRALTFASAEKVTALVERGGGLTDLASHQALDEAITMGRGGVFLRLTEQQYSQLQRPRAFAESAQLAGPVPSSDAPGGQKR